ncbi:MAG: citramalate synthase [Oscillospiraceae bacterium]|jgi:2-isopropylmalate synthase|nr:citramalate synthase [Oscillospiraceae bacterium]
MKIEILDSTLRDGAQGLGISYTVKDKLQIVKILDDYGVDFIEAGNPSSTFKDTDFFKQAVKLQLKNSKIVSFGPTRRKDTAVENDVNIKALLETDTEYITVFGKCSLLHTEKILKTSKVENLKMISDSLEFLTKNGKKVFFDAEHFFDGFKLNPEYALECIKTAENAGAYRIILCDTNGGTFSEDIAKIIQSVKSEIKIPLGIHCHNDIDFATANTVTAVNNGVTHIQGTFIGIGERCGNANLSAVIPNLQLKSDYHCVEHIEDTTFAAKQIAEISNIKLPEYMPYVGTNAFSHKAGMHVDGVLKATESFEHISPEVIGNQRNIVLSEVAGSSLIKEKLKKISPDIMDDTVIVNQLVDVIKKQEFKGFTYEVAEASFELIVLKYLGRLKNFFDVEYYNVTATKEILSESLNVAAVKINVKGRTEMAAAEGKGPVNAIDKALRLALSFFYPHLVTMSLTDYKVRIIDSVSATAALTRVLIESSDGLRSWNTVGVSQDIIEASVQALTDSLLYYLTHKND